MPLTGYLWIFFLIYPMCYSLQLRRPYVSRPDQRPHLGENPSSRWVKDECGGSPWTCIIDWSLPRTGNRHLGSFPAAVLLCGVLEPPGMAFQCPLPPPSTWKHRSPRISSVLILSPDWQQTLSKVLSQEPELMFTLLFGAISTQALACLLGLKSDHGIQWFWHRGFQ